MFMELKESDGTPYLKYEGLIGSLDGNSKTDRYKMITDHKTLYFNTSNKIDLFLSPIHQATDPKKFFKPTPIVRNTFGRNWVKIVEVTGIRGIVDHGHPVMHSLRKWLIHKLQVSGFNNTAITLRTGYKSIQSLQSYANIAKNVQTTACSDETRGIINGLHSGNITFNVNIHK